MTHLITNKEYRLFSFTLPGESRRSGSGAVKISGTERRKSEFSFLTADLHGSVLSSAEIMRENKKTETGTGLEPVGFP